MQKREKILAAALAGVLVFWFGLPILESKFLAPLKERQQEEARLQEELKQQFALRKELVAKDAKFREWRSRSLPPDPVQAQRLYQEWLTNLAQISGFSAIKVTAETKRPEGDTFVTVPVRLETQGTLQELATFLERFESVDLLHRMDRVDATSNSSEGDPELKLTLVAEGLSVRSAPPRDRLFAFTELFEAVDKDKRELTVASNLGFPEKVPFRVRIGDEFLNVTGISGNTWTVQRGVERTFAAPHAAGAGVEMFPLLANRKADADATEEMWTNSVFTKPAPPMNYVPRLAKTDPPPAVRGREWEWKLEVAGWNPAFGNKTYELISAPDGMRLDERSGTLSWRVSQQAPLGEHPVQVLVWGANGGREGGFTPAVNVRVRDPNRPPSITRSDPLTFYIGRESRTKIEASDPDGPASGLKYSLEEAPEGMTIDTATGEVAWTPAESLAPTETNVTVKVADSDEFPESASRTIPVRLEEDSAKYTYVTGIVSGGKGGTRAMIFDRAQDKPSRTVQEGDRFDVADISITVEKIYPTYLVVRRQDQQYRWNFDQPIVQMTPIAAPPASSAPQAVPENAAPGSGEPSAAPEA